MTKKTGKTYDNIGLFMAANFFSAKKSIKEQKNNSRKSVFIVSDFIMRYWLEAVFGLVLAGLGFAYRSLARRVKEQEAVKLGIQALLRDRIIQSYNYYVDKGYCPIYARENLAVLYTQYKALGGNGVIANLVLHLEDLPTDGSDDQ